MLSTMGNNILLVPCRTLITRIALEHIGYFELTKPQHYVLAIITRVDVERNTGNFFGKVLRVGPVMYRQRTSKYAHLYAFSQESKFTQLYTKT